MYQKSGDKIRPTATWKKTKQIWMLRTALGYLKRLAQTSHIYIDSQADGSAYVMPENRDVQDLNLMVKMLDQLVKRQIEIKEEVQ